MSERAKVANSAAQPSTTIASATAVNRIREADTECGNGSPLEWC